MSKFKPSISYFRGKFEAILPADVRSKAWDILFDIQDHVVTIDRDCGPTRLSISSNEGYPKSEALAILAVAVYTAMTGFDRLLSTGDLKDHLTGIYSVINFEACGALDRELVRSYFSIFIEDRASGRMEKAFEKVKAGYRFGWFDEQKLAVVNAKRALEFIPLLSLTISPFEKARRVKFCNQVIEHIENAKENAQELNDMMNAVKAGAQKIVDQVNTILETNPLAVTEDYRTAMKYLESAQKESQDYFDSLDTDEIDCLVKEALSLTPPCKK